MIDKKRFPAFASEKISSIEDISIFTYEEDVKLTDVFATLLTQNRVYLSDIRKVFQWYNLLLKEGLLKKEEVAVEDGEKPAKAEKEPKKAKADTAKKPSKPAASKEPKAAKPAVSKKAPVVKTGSSRGK